MTAARWALGPIQNPVRGLLHGSAALVAIAGVFALIARSPGGAARTIALVVFGIALVCVYSVSTLYHTVPWSERWKARMLRVDNAAMLVLVAATYTPVAAIVFDGWLTWTTLGVAWGIALAGVAQLIFFPRQTTGAAIAATAGLGWLAVLLLIPLIQRLPWTAILVAFIGGLFYTIGMVLVVTERPRLWPRVFSYHEMFHICAVAGSAAHFVMTWRWIAPFQG